MAGRSAIETSAVGIDIDNFAPGFWIGGVVVDNPTLSWLTISAFGNNFLVPPLTLGFSTPLAIATQSISVKFVAAPFGASISSAQGTPISVTVYERLEGGGSPVGASPGSLITGPTASLQTLTANQGSGGVANDRVFVAGLAAPGAGLRYRLWQYQAGTVSPADSPTNWRCIIWDIGHTATFGDLARETFMLDSISFPNGSPLPTNTGIHFSVESRVININMLHRLWFTTELS